MLSDPFFIVVAIACLAVLAILIMGINSFRVGTPDSAKRSNKFMRWRIAAQFVAVLIILAFVYYRQQTTGG